MLTGESLPVFKETGLPVFAGTVNWVRLIVIFTSFFIYCQHQNLNMSKML
jgi:hypothetical protein